VNEYHKKKQYYSRHIIKYQVMFSLPCRRLDFSTANKKCLLPADYEGMVRICSNCIQNYRRVFSKDGRIGNTLSQEKIIKPFYFLDEGEKE